MDASELAAQMYAECASAEQSARVVTSDEDAAAVRAEIRSLAKADGLRIRTARVDERVVAVRLDAKLWSESTATMEKKLTPP